MKKTNNGDIKTLSAMVIQRYFRAYLRRKTAKKQDIRSIKSEELDEFQTSFQLIKSSLENYYIKVLKNKNQKKYVDKLIIEIDELSNTLMNIKTFKDCEGISFKCSENSDILIKAKICHENELKKFKQHWWEKLKDQSE
ncbi:hypothetical protein FQR65_LT10407 [Abscondita terminalis]|nr:hypothetical protein FQR65_LT10407 [Abscondita terminalis]